MNNLEVDDSYFLHSFITYDWIMPGEWENVYKCLKHKDKITEELSDTDALDMGVIIIKGNDNLEFGMEVDLCWYIPWITGQWSDVIKHNTLLIFGNRYILIEISSDHVILHSVSGIESMQWDPCIGASLSFTNNNHELLTAYSLKKSVDLLKNNLLKGHIDRTIRITLESWLYGIAEIGEQFQYLLKHALPCIKDKDYFDPLSPFRMNLLEKYNREFNKQELLRDIDMFLTNSRGHADLDVDDSIQ